MAEEQLEFVKADILALRSVVNGLLSVLAGNPVIRASMFEVLSTLREVSDPMIVKLTAPGLLRYEETLGLFIDRVKQAPEKPPQ